LDRNSIIEEIFQLQDYSEFERISLEVFKYQAKANPIYKSFLSYLKVNPEDIYSLKQVPFLPISFFKSHEIKSGDFKPEKSFLSSTTTGNIPSKHHVRDLNLYERSFINGFEHFYGSIQNTPILALLPSYLEREGSSLIYMANRLIELSKRKESGFFLNNLNDLISRINELEAKGETYFLLGVSFALLDLAENNKLELKNAIVMETGGMKGKRKEITRKELHEELTRGLKPKDIHSEYGMTELLSQAYSKGSGLFETPFWMGVFVRETNDPLSVKTQGRGGLNIIDLANLDSCSFIATQDLGKIYPNRNFEVLGRFDDAEVRGCNLMFN
jgi:phenylacetate-coenzyme A ligase PaaK-like adenylate-forming protein